MKVMITGAGGFIGSHLVDFFLSEEHQVCATVKPGAPTNNLNQVYDARTGTTKMDTLDVKFLDVRDATGMRDAIESFRPDGIFHMAAQSYVKPSWEDPATTMDVNVNGTINVFEPVKALELDTRVIVACSSAEYGTITKDDIPIKESLPLQPLHPYGISKVAQDLLARQYHLNFGINTVRLRFFNQTGIRKVGDACADFATKIAKIAVGKADPVINVGNLETARDIQDIRDCISACWKAFQGAEAGEVYNCCTGRPSHIREVLELLIDLAGIDVKVNERSKGKLRYQDEPTILGDGTKLREATGYSPRHDIHETLEDMLEYWKEYHESGEPSGYFKSYYIQP